jgi:hypothetical protein
MQRAYDLPERTRLLVFRPAASPHARRMAIFRLPLPRLPPRKNKSRRRIFRQRRTSHIKFFRVPRLAQRKRKKITLFGGAAIPARALGFSLGGRGFSPGVNQPRAMGFSP